MAAAACCCSLALWAGEPPRLVADDIRWAASWLAGLPGRELCWDADCAGGAWASGDLCRCQVGARGHTECRARGEAGLLCEPVAFPAGIG